VALFGLELPGGLLGPRARFRLIVTDLAQRAAFTCCAGERARLSKRLERLLRAVARPAHNISRKRETLRPGISRPPAFMAGSASGQPKPDTSPMTLTVPRTEEKEANWADLLDRLRYDGFRRSVAPGRLNAEKFEAGAGDSPAGDAKRNKTGPEPS